MFGVFEYKFAHVTMALLNFLAPAMAHVQRDVAYGPNSIERADIYRPSDRSTHPVIVFLYGGSWREGSKERVAFVGAALARKGYVAVIPEYRHFPAVGLADILADNAAAVSWTIKHAQEFGGDPRRVVVAGHSSGAWAAIMLALDGKWLAQAGSEPKALAGVIGLAGPYVVSSMTEQPDQDVFAGADPEMEPINDCSRQRPPMLLLAGADDNDVLPRSTTALFDRISKLGGNVEAHIYPDLGHEQLVSGVTFPFSLWNPVAGDIDKFVGNLPENGTMHSCN